MRPDPEDVKKDRWGKDQGDILDELLAEQGIVEFATFGVTGEGKTMPTGLETMSWMILTKDEKIHHAFLDWDEKKIAPDGSKGYYYLHPLQQWERLSETSQHNHEYLLARRELNLPLTKEQEEILRKYDEEHQY